MRIINAFPRASTVLNLNFIVLHSQAKQNSNAHYMRRQQLLIENDDMRT